MRLRKPLVALAVGLFALFLLIVFTSQIEQHMFRRRAERLLAETQSLELRKTPWPEALQKFQHWGNARKLSGNCNQHDCSVEIRLTEPVYGFIWRSLFFVHLDDYLRWRFKLTYQVGPFARAEDALLQAYLHMGGRPAVTSSFVGMRDGIVWSKEFAVNLETFAHGNPRVWEGKYALSADIRTVPRFSKYDSRNPQLLLHSNYIINRPGGCEICVLGWVHFTPYADPNDMKRLMTINLSCLTRFHPCQTQQDIMPSAWTQFEREQEHVGELWGNRDCSESSIQMLGRDSENLIVGEIASYNEKIEGNEKRWFAHVTLVEKLKGGGNWKVGDIHDFEIFRPPDRTIGVGSKFIFNFDDPTEFSKIPAEAIAHCSPLQLTDANLNLVQRGVAEDYSSADFASARQW